MSVFSVPVTIGVDEERIVREIESNVETQVISKIAGEVKSIMFKKKSYYGDDEKEPLRNIIIQTVGDVVKANEKIIIEEAAKILSDKMSRTKAYAMMCPYFFYYIEKTFDKQQENWYAKKKG